MEGKERKVSPYLLFMYYMFLVTALLYTIPTGYTTLDATLKAQYQ